MGEHVRSAAAYARHLLEHGWSEEVVERVIEREAILMEAGLDVVEAQVAALDEVECVPLERRRRAPLPPLTLEALTDFVRAA